MIVRLHKSFDKKFSKLWPAQKQKTIERLKLFIKESFNPTLHNHILKGKYHGQLSINITGDLRAVYKLLDHDTALFVDIDTHSTTCINKIPSLKLRGGYLSAEALA